MVSHWNLSCSNSPQVSGTLLSILVYLNNAVAWMVSTRPPISKSSSPSTNPLVTVPRAQLQSVLPSLSCPTLFLFPWLILLLISISLTLWSTGTAKSTIPLFLFFLMIIIRSNRLPEIRWSVFILKTQRSLWVSFSRIDSGSCVYHLFVE